MRSKTRHLLIRGCALALVAMCVSKGYGLGPDTFSNPIIEGGQDPWVTEYNGHYYYIWSENDGIHVSESRRLEEIGYGTPKTVFQPQTGTSHSHDLWAPELHRLDDKWYIYFAADDGDNNNHRMYVLEGNSSDPLGSYSFKGQISDVTNQWAIDGTVWERNPGEQYFIWSGWVDQANNARQNIYIASMSDPLTISGPRVKISTPILSWETIGDPDVNEGPDILTHNGVTQIIYSASGAWTDDYALGQLTLTGNDPLNPSSWTKKSMPVFSKTADVFGPGHASFVQSPDGIEDWIVYHAAKQQGAGFDRNIRMQPFSFNPDDSPNFGSPASPTDALATPSGFFDEPVIANASFERDHVVGQGQAGYSLEMESFQIDGNVKVLANDGRYFSPISGGEGVQVVAIQAGDQDVNGLSQVIGPIRAGEYRVAAGLALSDDQAAKAEAWPGQFTLRLTALPRRGSEQEIILDEVIIDSAQFAVSAFSNFETVVQISPTSELLGRDLRLSLHSASVAAGSLFWEVKVDALDLQTALIGPATPRVDLNFSGSGSHLGATGFESMYGQERSDFEVGDGVLTVRSVPEDTFGNYESDPDDATNMFFTAIDPLDRTVVEASLQIDGLSENFQGGGIWLGTDQDHYIRLGVIHNSTHPDGPVVLEVLRESEAIWTSEGGLGNDIAIEQLTLTSNQPLTILLRLVRDGDMAEAYFSLDDGLSFTSLGDAFDAIATSQADAPSVEGGFKVGVYGFGGQTVGGASFRFDWFSAVSTLAGDLDGDGFVGVSDLNIVLANWNQNVSSADPRADFNGDGFVGIADLNVVLGNWNVGTPPAVHTIPEPSALMLMASAMFLSLPARRRGKNHRRSSHAHRRLATFSASSLTYPRANPPSSTL